jgi:hypothetical protein
MPRAKARSELKPPIQLSRALPTRDTLASFKSSARGSTLSLCISGISAKTLHQKQTFLSLMPLPVEIGSFLSGKRIASILFVSYADKLMRITL